MKPIAFTVPGEPVGKARARTVRSRRGKSVTYTPEKTASYESMVRLSYYQAAAGLAPLEGPVRVEISAYYLTPKAFKRPVRSGLDDSEAVRCTKAPDADNVSKSVLDALNKLAWKDDAQVSDLAVKKRYSQRPRVEVRIEAAA